MVKNVQSVAHQGLREWVIQRISALIMIVFTSLILGFFLLHPDVSFAEWHEFNASPWMKVVSILCIAATLYHAWIGMWTVFTDYIKPACIRMVLNTLVILFLLSLFVWALMFVGSL